MNKSDLSVRTLCDTHRLASYERMLDDERVQAALEACTKSIAALVEVTSEYTWKAGAADGIHIWNHPSLREDEDDPR
jgi:hypothetical protein